MKHELEIMEQLTAILHQPVFMQYEDWVQSNPLTKVIYIRGAKQTIYTHRMPSMAGFKTWARVNQVHLAQLAPDEMDGVRDYVEATQLELKAAKLCK